MPLRFAPFLTDEALKLWRISGWFNQLIDNFQYGVIPSPHYDVA